MQTTRDTDVLAHCFPTRRSSDLVVAKCRGVNWIRWRILWLSGAEPGRNRLGCVDTFRRYIYLHGTPDVTALGRPASHGCVRMRNEDVIELFDLVSAGTDVELHESQIHDRQTAARPAADRPSRPTPAGGESRAALPPACCRPHSVHAQPPHSPSTEETPRPR